MPCRLIHNLNEKTLVSLGAMLYIRECRNTCGFRCAALDICCTSCQTRHFDSIFLLGIWRILGLHSTNCGIAPWLAVLKMLTEDATGQRNGSSCAATECNKSAHAASRVLEELLCLCRVNSSKARRLGVVDLINLAVQAAPARQASQVHKQDEILRVRAS